MPERLVHGTRSWAEIEEAGGLTAGTCLATKPEIAEEYGDCATGNGGLAVIEIDTSLLDPEQFVCDEPSLYEPVDPTLAVSTLERKVRRARSRLADVGHDGPIGSRWDLSLAAAGTVRYDSPIPLAAIRLVYELDE